MRQTNKTFSCYFLSLWFRDSWCDREDYDNKYFDPDAALSEWKKKETDWFIHLPNLLHLQLSGCYLCPCCLYLLLFLFALGGSLLFFWFSQTSGLTFVIISWETITITRQDSGFRIYMTMQDRELLLFKQTFLSLFFFVVFPKIIRKAKHKCCCLLWIKHERPSAAGNNNSCYDKITIGILFDMILNLWILYLRHTVRFTARFTCEKSRMTSC